ncbi:hypothetical protein [Microbacterium rhizosphaerae]|uniref:Uncharacterized protein n=1 Tax=Microbacterium rhizosphaerae TaxID=1678237 RepID=A0ABZ0SGQ8_9MICO|nr:hypothetical protein [Microbacterium rhizosphaerae]WPR88319.1 hypothetical protein SM116_11045 [Microbacterium rhizosphaerae]
MSANLQTTPELPATRRRPSTAARRFGYLIAILVNAAILYLINVEPSWRVVPFLTSATVAVLPWINGSIIVGMAANLVYLFTDQRWVRAAGDLATTAVGLAAMFQLWIVFPFEFHPAAPWTLLTRILITLAIAGSAIAIVVQLIRFVQVLARPPRHDGT